MSRSRIQTIFYSAAALISLVGLAEATYLTVVFLSGETAVCGGSPDCFQVMGSSYVKIGGVQVRDLGHSSYSMALTIDRQGVRDHTRHQHVVSRCVNHRAIAAR